MAVFHCEEMVEDEVPLIILHLINIMGRLITTSRGGPHPNTKIPSPPPPLVGHLHSLAWPVSLVDRRLLLLVIHLMVEHSSQTILSHPTKAMVAPQDMVIPMIVAEVVINTEEETLIGDVAKRIVEIMGAAERLKAVAAPFGIATADISLLRAFLV